MFTFREYLEICGKDANSINIYEKAKKMKVQAEMDALISEICNNLQWSEINLRNIVMWSLEYDDDKLIDLSSQTRINKGVDSE